MRAQFAALLLALLVTGCAVQARSGIGTARPTENGWPQEVQPDVEAEVQAEAQADSLAGAPEVAPPPAEYVDDDLYADEPDLVPVEGNADVQVVYGNDTPVFYTDGFYWLYGDDGVWMRSTIHTGGWAIHGDIPVHVRTVSNPGQYRNYKPDHYTPRTRKEGVRPPNSRASYHPRGTSVAHRNYNENRPNRVLPTKPVQKAPAHSVFPTHKPAQKAPLPTHTTTKRDIRPTHAAPKPTTRAPTPKTTTKTITTTKTTPKTTPARTPTKAPAIKKAAFVPKKAPVPTPKKTPSVPKKVFKWKK